MKRLVCFVMCFLLLGLSACGGGGGAATDGSAAPATTAALTEGGFRVGYGEANITPETSVPLDGYGQLSSRYSTGVTSYLWATCCAITDAEDNTILLFGLDLINSTTAYSCVEDVSNATGVPVENICMSASHTHSAPATTSPELKGILEYNKLLGEQLVVAAEAAMADRKSAEIFGGSVQTESLNFVRRYIMNDGSFAGANYGDTSSGYKAHESEADAQLQLVKFVRQDGCDVILTNFQTHPHRTGGLTKKDISADIVGVYRDEMAKALDCKVVYFTGASGNINPNSFIQSENVYQDYKTHGQAMAKAALSVTYQPIASGRVQVSSQEYVGKVNHDYEEYADLCQKLYGQWTTNQITTEELLAQAAAQGLKLNSAYHAYGINARSKLPETSPFTMQTFCFGDVGFVVAPFEMYDTNGMFIKDHSPFAMTLVATCSNGSNGYLPSELGFTNGGYEPDITRFVRGTAEEVASGYVEMLSALHAEK